MGKEVPGVVVFVLQLSCHFLLPSFVAVMLKDSQKSKPEKRCIDIYTLSGRPISSIPVSTFVTITGSKVARADL